MVERGQRYREAGRSGTGSGGLVWQVENVFTGTDGIEYAGLVCAADRSLRKTLAIAALGDRRRFALVGD